MIDLTVLWHQEENVKTFIPRIHWNLEHLITNIRRKKATREYYRPKHLHWPWYP